jgi:hypothetical protein
VETTTDRPAAPSLRSDEADPQHRGVAFVGAVGQQLDRAREARERRAARARDLGGSSTAA